MPTGELEKFSKGQIEIINNAVALAEELVSEYYKMSAGQWLRGRYDVKTLRDLTKDEIVYGPFAQIIRYEAKKKDTLLGSSIYDFYKICLQDHAILETLVKTPQMPLFAFSLYILTHELIHVVRFGQFLQNFNATENEKHEEETRVHEQTYQILKSIRTPGLNYVFGFYDKWRTLERNFE
ncbi:MAG: hypothetical protein R6U27_06610 [Desulfobacterales bacterium]